MSATAEIIETVHTELDLEYAAIVRGAHIIHREECTCDEYGTCLWSMFVDEAVKAVTGAV